jgi:dGTPase
MAAYGGFDHNAQALRVVTRLERRYAAYDGLNLVWETLEGLVKHNGPLLDADRKPTGRYEGRGVPGAILEYDELQDLLLATHAGGEAPAAAIADDIAYNAHDLDDGLRAGLFAIEDLMAVPFLRELIEDVDSRYPGLDLSRRIHEVVRRVITRFVEDATAEGERRLAELGPRRADDIRAAGTPVIAFSRPFQDADAAIKGFLHPHMYRHPRLLAVRDEAERVVRDLFHRLVAEPTAMPEEWQAGLSGGGEARLARRVADYIAGMTDRYALLEHRRLVGTTPDLSF